MSATTGSSTSETVPGQDATVRVRLDLAYDGTDFRGWARQPGLRTVQGELEDALATVLRAGVGLTVAGRTDAGVHARGQVAHADVPVRAWEALPGRGDHAPEVALVRRVNGVLARAMPGRHVRGTSDVLLRGARIAPEGFDARFGALRRRYAYRIDDGAPDPLRRYDVLWHGRPLDVEAMDAAGALLVGEHDFAAFCKPREGATTVRELQTLTWHRADPAGGPGLLVADVRADAFCHSMVRALVGACLAVGEGRAPLGHPAAVLARGVRDPGVAVAPAHGLTLEEVVYPPDADLASRAHITRRRRDE